MSRLLHIPIENIRRRPDVRSLNDDTVAALEESIAQVGLINPICVRPVGNDIYEIIAGSHRFAACDLLGFREITALVVDADDLHAELGMIDENLCRAELSPSDRATQTARRKAIYIELHPETAHGANLEGAGVAKSATPETPAFTKATAQVTGQSERTVRLDAERGEKVIPEAMDLIRGTKLDTGAYLDKLKKLTPHDQVTAAKRDLDHIRQQEREGTQRGGIASRYAGRAVPEAAPDADAFARFIKLADGIEALGIASVIAGSGRQRAVLGQRASGLADLMGEIMEGLSQ